MKKLPVSNKRQPDWLKKKPQGLRQSVFVKNKKQKDYLHLFLHQLSHVLIADLLHQQLIQQSLKPKEKDKDKKRPLQLKLSLIDWSVSAPKGKMNLVNRHGTPRKAMPLRTKTAKLHLRQRRLKLMLAFPWLTRSWLLPHYMLVFSWHLLCSEY